MTLNADDTRLFDRWSLPVMILDRDLRYIYANASYLKTVHKTEDELLGAYVFDEFPESPDRIESVLNKFKRTLGGEMTMLDAQPFRVTMEDGDVQELVWQATQDPLYDRDGQIIGMIQRAQDITEQYELEQRNKAIGYELSHRVKNIMAVVSSVARITGRNASDVESFVKSFTARLNAMSRTNDLLAESDWRGLDVRTIFHDELSPFDKPDAPVYSLKGPKVRLTIDASKDLSMVAHELATNATKYGSLRRDGGHLDVSWTRDDDRLTIRWQEQCVDPIDVADTTGFGTRLFDMLPYADVDRQFTPNGLHLTIVMDGEKVFA